MIEEISSESKAVVNWESEMAKAAVAASASERPALASISLKAGIMTYEKVAVPGNKLPCIIVASVMERKFYEDRYDPKKPASPACFAFHNGADGEAWVPHPSSHNKQAEACVLCPRNEWSSDLGGGKGKACKEVRKLALIPSGSSKEMALLNIPVMSVKNWSNYVNGVAASAKRPPWGVVTEISVVPDARSQFVVKFAPLELVPDDKLGEVYEKIGLATQVLNTPYDYQSPGPTNADNAATAKKKKY